MIVRKIKNRVNKLLGIRHKHGSETAKVRHLVLPYCNGLGCDVGFGGDKVKKDNCLGIDFKKPYAFAGDDKVDIACDLSKESIPVQDSYFDYVYSSHLIEDFPDTERVLEDFMRILKSNGHLILVFPDQPEYEKTCLATGQPLNTYHVHKNMGARFMLEAMDRVNQRHNYTMDVLLASDCEIDYNVVIVARIQKHS